MVVKNLDREKINICDAIEEAAGRCDLEFADVFSACEDYGLVDEEGNLTEEIQEEYAAAE